VPSLEQSILGLSFLPSNGICAVSIITLGTFAFSKLANNGHTCAAPQVLILAKDWEFRPAFLERLRYWLGEYAGNAPFYPGSDKIHLDFAALPNDQVIGGDTSVFEKQQHATLIPSVDTDEGQSDVFTREALCPVLAEVPIDRPSDNALSFLRTATKFVSNKCFGSLTCNILIIPNEEVKAIRNDFDELIANMPLVSLVSTYGPPLRIPCRY